jgi:hypothetical protein
MSACGASGPQHREDETGRLPRGTVFAAGINGSTETLWDWLHLWLLPLLLPTLVVPALLPMVRSRVKVLGPPTEPGARPDTEGERNG